MENLFLIQLIGVLITGAGALALTALASLYGSPLTREERHRGGDRQGNTYHLPFNWETFAAALVLLSGIGILMWSKFDLCLFLDHWLPDLPQATRLFLSCR